MSAQAVYATLVMSSICLFGLLRKRECWFWLLHGVRTLAMVASAFVGKTWPKQPAFDFSPCRLNSLCFCLLYFVSWHLTVLFLTRDPDHLPDLTFHPHHKSVPDFAWEPSASHPRLPEGVAATGPVSCLELSSTLSTRLSTFLPWAALKPVGSRL